MAPTQGVSRTAGREGTTYVCQRDEETIFITCIWRNKGRQQGRFQFFKVDGYLSFANERRYTMILAAHPLKKEVVGGQDD